MSPPRIAAARVVPDLQDQYVHRESTWTQGGGERGSCPVSLDESPDSIRHHPSRATIRWRSAVAVAVAVAVAATAAGQVGRRAAFDQVKVGCGIPLLPGASQWIHARLTSSPGPDRPSGRRGGGRVVVQHDTVPLRAPCWTHTRLGCVPQSTTCPPYLVCISSEPRAIQVSRQWAIADRVAEVVFRQ
jgi:hypothetical protein